MYVFRYIILRIEKNRFTVTNRLIQIPLSDLMFEYANKKSYVKLLLIVTCWAFEFIAIAAKTTMFFGLFIAFKYI